jgi:hypothetical protein
MLGRLRPKAHRLALLLDDLQMRAGAMSIRPVRVLTMPVNASACLGSLASGPDQSRRPDWNPTLPGSPFSDLGRYGTIVLLVEQNAHAASSQPTTECAGDGRLAPGGKPDELSSNEASLSANLGCARGTPPGMMP